MWAANLVAVGIGGALVGATVATRRLRKERTTNQVSTGNGAPRVVSMPHGDWQPGQKQPLPYPGSWLAWDPTVEEKAAVYPMTISAVVPRPIALVSSVDKDGVLNVAPYSYFNAMCHNPLTVCVGINHSPARPEGKKDSLLNFEETGEFVINIMSDWFVEAANHTCGDFDRGVDEAALAGLTTVPSTKVRAPRLGESALHMECKLKEVVTIRDTAGKPTVGIVIAEVVLLHIHEGVAGRTPTGKLVVDPIKLRPVCRLGGTMYGRVTELYDIGRPTKAQANEGPASYTASVAKPAGPAPSKL